MSFRKPDDNHPIYPEEIVFPSGPIFYPNAGFIGINQDLDICEGYDIEMRYYDEQGALTDEDRIYLANLMIKRWEQYKASIYEASFARRHQNSQDT